MKNYRISVEELIRVCEPKVFHWIESQGQNCVWERVNDLTSNCNESKTLIKFDGLFFLCHHRWWI